MSSRTRVRVEHYNALTNETTIHDISVTFDPDHDGQPEADWAGARVGAALPELLMRLHNESFARRVSVSPDALQVPKEIDPNAN